MLTLLIYSISAIRTTVMMRETMMVGARKVNGLHGLFKILSFRPMGRLVSGETRNLLVKSVKGVLSGPYFAI